MGTKPVKCGNVCCCLCVTDFEVQGYSSVTEKFEKTPVDAVANVPKITTVKIT